MRHIVLFRSESEHFRLPGEHLCRKNGHRKRSACARPARFHPFDQRLDVRKHGLDDFLDPLCGRMQAVTQIEARVQRHAGEEKRIELGAVRFAATGTWR